MPQKKSSDKNKPQSGQRSEAYATLFYHHPIPMWVYDLNTLAFLEVNDAAVQNYGYSREEFLSMTLKDIRPPEDIDLLLKDTAKERPTLQYSGEWRHTLKNGKVILVEIRSHTIEYNGRPAALVVATDVTERKRAEDAFIESHRKYQKVVESASEIIYTTDLRGHFLYANPAGLRSVGYSLEEMHKRSYLDLVLPEHRKRVKRAYFKQYLEKTPTSYIEFPFRTKFGTVCWFGQNATLLYQEGTIVGFQLIAREITEKVHAETQIKHLNRIYSVLSNINQAIVRIHDKQQLLNEACRIAITEGNFLMAWIGLLNTETLAIDVVASAGKVDNYLSNIKINLGDDKCCFDPTGRAMKTGIRVISMDIEHDEAMDPLRDDALKLGYRSSASFPLRVLGTIIGTFNLYSDEIGFFTEDELKLLDELAMDISFALEYIERDTERKQAEEEVQKKEELLRLLIETLPIGIWIIDKTGKIIHSNPAGRKIWEGEIFVGIEQYGEYKGWWTETGKEILPEEWAAARAISKGEISINELVDIQCFDGTRKTIYNSAQPIRDTEGKIIGAFIVNEDITKRRRAEEAIVDSEARYRRLFEAARDGILILNADTGRIEDVNPFLAEMLGFSHEDLLGKDIIDLGFLKDVIANKEKFLELQQKEYVRYENLPLESVDGRKFDVEFVSNVYLVNNKKVIQCNIRDITDRKRAEVAFVESEERFRQLAENIHEVFWLTDRSKQTMLYISPAYELIWGRTRESLYASSLTWLNSIHPEDRERVHQAAQAKQVEGVYDEEYRIIRPDGGIRWIRDRAFPVQNEKGEVYRIAGVAEDITERIRLAEDRKNLEAQLHQAQKLESLGTLASGIAHDFNNILTIIIGHASLLERSKADPLTIKKNTEAIIGAGMRGADLVKQMLTFARKADVMIEAVRLNDIVKEIVKLIYQTFPKTI
ncbi:MAG: PAS domain S-box protein, partial [Bacteroidetes bacterium]